MTDPILLTDEQIRAYIVDGYILLESSVADEIHATINEKLTAFLESSPNPGNNVLPVVPEMRHILNSPEVRGALISVVGEGCVEHPHRYCHSMPPAEKRAGKAEIKERLARGCHQDAYTPLAQQQRHYSRLARIIYYPQDTPVSLGPTYVIPGTQYNGILTDEDRARAIPVDGPAGTVALTHFDIGHSAGVSLLKRRRHMIKFIFMRTSEPKAPSWNCSNEKWRRPRKWETPFDMSVAWSVMWDWMCGKRDRYASLGDKHRAVTKIRILRLIDDLDKNCSLSERLAAANELAKMRSKAGDAIPALVDILDDGHQAVRIAAAYTLGAIGKKAVSPLAKRLLKSGSKEEVNPSSTPWNEGKIAMNGEAHALAAIGKPALPALRDLLATGSEWTRINAAFALGEMDSGGTVAVSDLVYCLEDDSHRLVRTTLESLGIIRNNVSATDVSPLLSNGHAGWNKVLLRDWSAWDQVRMNAAMACVRLGKAAIPAESALVEALDDPCGYVSAYSMYALQNLGTPSAAAAAQDYLYSQRWDPSLRENRSF
jgi:HEAT repeat protein